jgi:hypothetical protein
VCRDPSPPSRGEGRVRGKRSDELPVQRVSARAARKCASLQSLVLKPSGRVRALSAGSLGLAVRLEPGKSGRRLPCVHDLVAEEGGGRRPRGRRARNGRAGRRRRWQECGPVPRRGWSVLGWGRSRRAPLGGAAPGDPLLKVGDLVADGVVTEPDVSRAGAGAAPGGEGAAGHAEGGSGLGGDSTSFTNGSYSLRMQRIAPRSDGSSSLRSRPQ